VHPAGQADSCRALERWLSVSPRPQGRSITGRNLSYAYAATAHACEGATGLKVITGFDRHSVRSATQKIAYVAYSRGREDIEAFVESIADPSQIQNRTGDRKAAVEMAFEPDQNDRRAEVKRLFRHLQRIRAAKEMIEHARTMDLCRQAAETIEASKAQSQAGTSKSTPSAAPRRLSDAPQKCSGTLRGAVPSPETRAPAKPGARQGL
jgi:hypothetical protein